FEEEKRGAKADELKKIYQELRGKYLDLPNVKSKPDMEAGLRAYEQKNIANCVLIQSLDQFYGINSTGKLSPFIQWVFIPASKDIIEESQESKNSAFEKLLERTVRSKIDFSEKISDLKDKVCVQYKTIIDAEQVELKNISNSLQRRLQVWAHPDITAKVRWNIDEEKAVKIDEPSALSQFGERGFEGALSRFGHGLQRSYLFALLQELNELNDQSAPTLIMAIEEPEIYQHPPQSKYLAETLYELAGNNTQIMICSHSPLYVPGNDFEKVRIVREEGQPSSSYVSKFTYEDLSKVLQEAGGDFIKEQGTMAKLFPLLNAIINEMFFCKKLILVEGIEDIGYITTQLVLDNKMNQFRKNGCHIVPVGGKTSLIQTLAMAKLLDISVFMIFDADTHIADKKINPEDAKAKRDNESRITKHKKDNKILLNLAGYKDEPEWPTETIWKENMVMWKTEIAQVIKEEIGTKWEEYSKSACDRYDNAGGLQKNPLAIAYLLDEAHKNNIKSKSLEKLVASIISFADKL
ncbi:AAA family ATPase, partial [Patescibacteria group bacterium]|nr:AAA family ATPase [Patescibacteria group bacterium]